jgi:hypothetical protein
MMAKVFALRAAWKRIISIPLLNMLQEIKKPQP